MKPGDVISHYEILEPIGKGGMGEVYRAKDSKLGRDVAIKVLPEELARAEERIRRFQREAVVLASLNHPNIAGIHGLEESNGVQALVLELVEGPTLADRIAQGPIPQEEALGIAKQIAEALDAGHEAGIVHRDLKPANIKLKEDGTVKVLDYGLAKAFEGEGAGGNQELSQSPTLTRQGTQVGVILGTAGYMSPEQAKGKRVDKRTDIFAFGAVLYEMLTGKKAFPGEDVSETLAAVIRAEPEWSQLPRMPASVRVLLRRCLDKDAKRRLRDIGEARVVLEGADVETAETPATSHRAVYAWAVSALALGLVLGALAMKSSTASVDPTPGPVVRFDIRVPESPNGHLPTLLAMTPDERSLVFARGSGEAQQLFVRSLDEEAFTPIPGTEGGAQPFLSPDGEWLGFHADGRLKKVRLSGGPTAVLCELRSVHGATWVDDERIVFASEGALWELPAAGGTPRRLTGEATSRVVSWPDVLPGSKAVLFAETPGAHTAVAGGGVGVDDRSRVAVVSLETGKERVLIDNAIQPRFLRPGHLLFVRDETLWAVPFDLASLELDGEPLPVLQGIHAHGSHEGAQYAVSPNGSLAYSSGSGFESLESRLVFVDRSGIETPLPHEPGGYFGPRLSPDGRKVALSDGDSSKWDIWVLDVDRPARTRLTFDVLGDQPAWTSDGRRVAYASRASGEDDLYWMPADANGDPERLLENPSSNQRPYDFHPDGRTLLFGDRVSSANYDIWTMTFGEEAKPLVASEFNERAADFSPDGRWVAYTSNRSGRTEVYVTSYLEAGAAIAVSTSGGTEPAWSPTGRELFFRNGDAMLATQVRLEPELRIGTPLPLFEGSYLGSPAARTYDVTRDGQRFLMVKSESEASTAQIHIVLNWREELERLVPSRP
ncbi:MAG TPA: protein kinase [Vicinamibacteria bacterium]|nr:protein kinase [Vicinamibacteria bacterium]